MNYANNTPFKCILVDDDQLSIDILENLISKIPDLLVIKTYVNPANAINDILDGDDIDFLFLDIRMDISGLDVARMLRDKVRFLFFVTSYEEYAIDAFGVNGDKFLVKPIVFTKLLTAVNEVLEKENKQRGFSTT